MLKARACLDGLYGAGAILGGLCLIAVVGMVVLQVVTRWLGLPLPGVPELSGYAIGNAFLLPLGYAFKNGAHIRITLLIERLRGRWRWIAELVCLMTGVVIACFFAYHMTAIAHISYLIGEVSQGADAMRLWLPQTGMAAGACILLIAITDQLLCHILAQRRVSPLTELPQSQ